MNPLAVGLGLLVLGAGLFIFIPAVALVLGILGLSALVWGGSVEAQIEIAILESFANILSHVIGTKEVPISWQLNVHENNFCSFRLAA